MPATSENQRRAAGMALSAKRGETPVSKLRGAAKTMHDDMSEEQLRHYAVKSSEACFASFLDAFRKVAASEVSDIPETESAQEEKAERMEGETPEEVNKDLGPEKIDQVDEFFKITPDVSGEAAHDFYNTIGADPHAAEEHIYTEAQKSLRGGNEMPAEPDQIPGGKADEKDPNADPGQVSKGIAVEMEHTDDPTVAKEITKDHLTEFDNYYTALDDMETRLKADHGTDPTKVAFVVGFAQECLDRGLEPWEVKAAAAVVHNLVPDTRATFQKVAGELERATGPRAPKPAPVTPVGAVDEDNDSPAQRFMVNYASNELPKMKKGKNGAKGGLPHPKALFGAQGHKLAIAEVAANRKNGGNSSMA